MLPGVRLSILTLSDTVYSCFYGGVKETAMMPFVWKYLIDLCTLWLLIVNDHCLFAYCAVISVMISECTPTENYLLYSFILCPILSRPMSYIYLVFWCHHPHLCFGYCNVGWSILALGVMQHGQCCITSWYVKDLT